MFVSHVDPQSHWKRSDVSGECTVCLSDAKISIAVSIPGDCAVWLSRVGFVFSYPAHLNRPRGYPELLEYLLSASKLPHAAESSKLCPEH